MPLLKVESMLVSKLLGDNMFLDRFISNVSFLSFEALLPR